MSISYLTDTTLRLLNQVHDMKDYLSSDDHTISEKMITYDHTKK